MYYFGRVSNTVIFFSKWKLDKCVSFSLQKTVAWSAWLTFLVKALAPRLVCTTFKKRKKEDHPDEIQSTIFSYLPIEKQTKTEFWFFLKNLHNYYRRERLCLWICVWSTTKNEKRKNTILTSVVSSSNFSPYFLALQLKKTVNKWRWLSVLNKKETTKNCAEIIKYSFRFWSFTEYPNFFWPFFWPIAFSRNFFHNFLTVKICWDIR